MTVWGTTPLSRDCRDKARHGLQDKGRSGFVLSHPFRRKKRKGARRFHVAPAIPPSRANAFVIWIRTTIIMVEIVRRLILSIWQVQEAKTRLSEVIEEAQNKGPQIITRHGTERAVVLSISDYRALTAHRPNLKEYLLGGPKFEDFEIERDRDTGRDISL